MRITLLAMSQIGKKKPNDSGHPHNTTDAKTTQRCVTTDSPENKFRPTLFSYSRTPTQASSGNQLRPGQLSLHLFRLQRTSQRISLPSKKSTLDILSGS